MNTSTSTPWWRWLLTLVIGVLLWEAGKVLASLAAVIVAGDESAIYGSFWPLIALSLVQTVVIVFGIKYVWRIVNGDWASIGFVSENWKQDALYGAAVGLALALLQFFVILPLTGGAQRTDVIASAEIMGSNPFSLIAAIILGWFAGAFSEEIFYRGHFIRSLSKLFGGGPWAVGISSVLSIALFAYGHSYQGWIGILSTGFIALIYTLLFLWRKRLTTGIVAHGVYNTLAFLSIYFLLT
jgi:membrane protease YdiL (CAAX protease family)